MRLHYLFSFLFLSTLLSAPAQARVFSYESNTVAAYFRGAAGMISSGDQYFASSSGASTKFNDEVEYSFAGELGFKFRVSDKLDTRIGIELVQTKDINVTGKNSGGTALMDIESRVVVFNPTVTFDFKFPNPGYFRNSFFLGAGYGSATLTNTYALTGAGTAAYPSASADYKEAVEGNAVTLHAGLASEFLLLDNVTLMLELGYRQADFKSLKHKDTIATVNGTKNAGGVATYDDGTTRHLNISGGFVGLSFRFYIPPL